MKIQSRPFLCDAEATALLRLRWRWGLQSSFFDWRWSRPAWTSKERTLLPM